MGCLGAIKSRREGGLVQCVKKPVSYNETMKKSIVIILTILMMLSCSSSKKTSNNQIKYLFSPIIKTFDDDIPSSLEELRLIGISETSNSKSDPSNSLLLKEGADFKIIPLGDLPWTTKLGTNRTSLALVTK